MGWEGSVTSGVGDPRENESWIIGMEKKCRWNVSLLKADKRRWVSSDVYVHVHS